MVLGISIGTDRICGIDSSGMAKEIEFSDWIWFNAVNCPSAAIPFFDTKNECTSFKIFCHGCSAGIACFHGIYLYFLEFNKSISMGIDFTLGINGHALTVLECNELDPAYFFSIPNH